MFPKDMVCLRNISVYTLHKGIPRMMMIIIIIIIIKVNLLSIKERIKIIKVKLKFTLEQATKAHRGSKGIALLFL